MARKAKRTEAKPIAVGLAANRHSALTLFTRSACARSHAVRMVLSEKNIQCDLIVADGDVLPDDLPELNPYGTVPTLVDRGLILHEPRIIMEYLDERFPHPPLMAVDPVTRAHARMAIYRVEQDWYSLLDDLDGTERQSEKARKILRESLIASSELFAARPYFLSDEFSLVDCAVTPILWRLHRWGIELPAVSGKPVYRYAERMFKRESFRASLTELEREMRP